jgi:hypothetical protein
MWRLTLGALFVTVGVSAAVLCTVASQLDIDGLPAGLVVATIVSSAVGLAGGTEVAWVGALIAAAAESLGALDALLVSRHGWYPLLGLSILAYSATAAWLRGRG